MYYIYIGDTKVMETPLPCYVYYDAAVQSWRTCDEPQAEALYITQTVSETEMTSYYADIDYKTQRHEDFPVARIVKVD